MNATSNRLRAFLSAAVLALAGALGGCCSGADVESPIQRGALPLYADVAVAYNARVLHLDRLWAVAIIQFESVDAKGNEIDEQGDGHLQIILPAKLYLTVGKVGEVGYELGSDETRYWWIDVRNKSAQVGTHKEFSPAIGERAGLPVHPLDLVEVLGIVPLSPQASTMTWSEDGRRLLLGMPTRFGQRLLALDPETYEPREIRLLNPDGETVVASVLTDPATVELPEKSWPHTRTPSKATVSVPSTRTTITLWLQDLENRGSRMDPSKRAFDFEALVREYGVKEIQRIEADVPLQPRPG